MADDTLPPENNEPEATIDNVEINDLVDAAAQESDPLVKELVATEKVDDDKKETVVETKPKQVDKEDKTAQTTLPTEEEIKQAASKLTAQSPQEDVAALKKQLEFYQMLHGDVKPEQKPFQEEQKTEQNKTQQQQQYDPFANVQINQDDLIGLLSGEPERALPVIKKFLATAVIIGRNEMVREQINITRVNQYNTAVVDEFNTRYEDLKGLAPIIKYAGDQIEQEYKSRGINKYPHEVIDEVGIRARLIRDQLIKTPAPQRKTIKQGELPDTKTAPPTKEKLDEQKKEMYDLLEQ